MIGPTQSGTYLVMDAAGFCVATVKNDIAYPIECRAIANMLARSPERRGVLEHVLIALKADDEGQRHEDLIRILQVELQQTFDCILPTAPQPDTTATREPWTPADLEEGFRRLADRTEP